MANPLTTHLQKLRRQRQFKEDLTLILETDHGKRFFAQMLHDCNVTRPRFFSDPMTTQWNEGRRHLAMSYLNAVGRDDPQNLIDIIEQETQNGR